MQCLSYLSHPILNESRFEMTRITVKLCFLQRKFLISVKKNFSSKSFLIFRGALPVDWFLINRKTCSRSGIFL